MGKAPLCIHKSILSLQSAIKQAELEDVPDFDYKSSNH